MTIRLRLLQLAARRPLLALGLLAAVPAAAVAIAIGARHSAVDDDGVLAGNPRAILGRVWFDKLPEKPTDETKIWIWFGGGIGLYESGSYYRYSVDFFDFERQKDKLAMTYLQDKKNVDVRFKVSRCDEKPPFDLCLELNTPLGGQKRYYGFGDVEDQNTRVPWSKDILRSAQARAVPQ